MCLKIILLKKKNLLPNIYKNTKKTHLGKFLQEMAWRDELFYTI